MKHSIISSLSCRNNKCCHTISLVCGWNDKLHNVDLIFVFKWFEYSVWKYWPRNRNTDGITENLICAGRYKHFLVPLRISGWFSYLNKSFGNQHVRICEDLPKPVNVATYQPSSKKFLMASSNGSIFRVTGPLCGKFTGHLWIPLTKASEAGLCRFL